MKQSFRKLQERCGTVPDGAFGKNTARAIAEHFELERKKIFEKWVGREVKW